ncbi:hypothetical protein [Alkalilacustris brevis]|uniref:hypothetical protein n=1 Tax=Alkalilacustris brevis TaxID=2026338 RepID=UPI000E0DC092|nr:hypothetical protein [Alkalilacustris brevis]
MVKATFRPATAPPESQRGSGHAPDDEALRAIAAELAAALGQIDASDLDPDTCERVERALLASKQLTRLVRGTPEETPAPAPKAAAGMPDLVGYRVLIVAPDEGARAQLGQFMADMGARYDAAEDATAAQAHLGREVFDLALIDPRDNIRESIAQVMAVRSGAGHSGRIPVLVLAAPDDESGHEAMREAGADIVLETGDTAALWQAIKQLVESSAPAAAPVPDRLVIDEDRYRRLIEIAGEDGAIELLERLLEDLRQVERGLVRALEEPNSAEIRTQTHVLIALAGAVGADALQKQAETLNCAAHRREPEDMRSLGEQTLGQLAWLIRFIAREGKAARQTA